MKRQLVYCSNTAKTGEPLTPHNHHLFKFETSFQINPCEMLLIIPRNDEYSVLFQQGIYKKSRLRAKSGIYYICLNVYNDSENIISIDSLTMLRNFTQQNNFKKNYLILSERDVHKMTHDLHFQ